jgi:TonB family protein
MPNAEVVRSHVDRAALDALRRWRFEPIVRDGTPVAQRAKIRLAFKPS